MDDLCNLALAKLVDLSNEVHVEFYSHFDALTGVRILLVLAPDEYGADWGRRSDLFEKGAGYH